MPIMEDAIAKTTATQDTLSKDGATIIKEQQETIDSLKKQMDDMHSKLLEAAVLNNKYVQSIQNYQKQIEQLKKPPLFICSVVEMIDNMVLLRQHGSNQEVVTKVPDGMKDQIKTNV